MEENHLSQEDEELASLADIYSELRKDATDVAKDLVSGIDSLKFSAIIMLGFSIVFALLAFYSIFNVYPLNFWGVVSSSLGTLGAIISGAYVLVEYRRLKKKYSRLLNYAKSQFGKEGS